mmetsp:Transcript_22424/g.47786  ORF Transcript_22424/g.47786 Transcript_22424/m.47786 type:complete len:598 (+) Transcript_22424:97-1890(+)|eukprot:CAMPEP_0206482716 /NCGR_PEP_ID=MMETSP0324_2-20121206/39021_1 /ASSEMBLY_ACC=CAM_ASM_000836 /TAXON_ID=2866 /ORGANISM="Crypthecodinium cohnii, Strain Seligo" /LENGTH=597 /DNA_ID=CAMNT_0053960679 /DNA_START=89 /DNA_END=1882 /DNA_ORIENTATION=-
MELPTPETCPSEEESLVSEDLQTGPGEVHGRRRRIVATGCVSFLLSAAGFAAWRSLRGCVPAHNGEQEESIVSLYEGYPQDLINLADERDHDPQLVVQWLRETSNARHEAQKENMDTESMDKLKADMNKILSSEDPDEARKLAEKAIANAVKVSKAKRADLKRYLKSHHRNLKHHKKYTPWEQAQLASCVFDSLTATTTIASVAANFNDASKTCWGVKAHDLFAFNNNKQGALHSNVCAVNVFAVLGAVLSLSSTLSAAADDCAATLIPNVDALCAQAVTGLTVAVAGMGGAATLLNSACRATGWYNRIPPGLVPSNLGDNDAYFAEHPEIKHRRLEEEEEGQQSAAPRQLLFGGGKGSTATQCTIEITSAMWALASAALGINSAGNRGLGGSCPPENILTGSKHRGKSLLYTVPEGLCVTDVSQILVGFLGAITYMELAAVNCLDVLNVGAICGAGVTGVMTAMAGISQAAAGVWLACDVAQIPLFHKLLDIATVLDERTGNLLSKKLLGGSYDKKKRRLMERVENDIDDLKARFKTPDEAFMSIGFNLTDAEAEWRTKDVPPASDERLAEILQNKASEQPEVKSSLFSGSNICQA